MKGKIWSSRHVDTLPGGALLEVEIDGGDRLIAFDPLGCDTEEAVLVTQGSVAAAYFIDRTDRTAPVDALIVGSIDETSGK
ncbi:MAG: hypothetical protein OXF07_11015 [Rhodobacter sp.]|nr:hypothetical protein [Rhodobacter sp.]MCY4242936.1 hypothetical protein [Rhodobacter sp.]